MDSEKKELAKYRLEQARDDFFVVSKPDVEEQIENAQKFYDVVKQFVERQS